MDDCRAAVVHGEFGCETCCENVLLVSVGVVGKVRKVLVASSTAPFDRHCARVKMRRRFLLADGLFSKWATLKLDD